METVVERLSALDVHTPERVRRAAWGLLSCLLPIALVVSAGLSATASAAPANSLNSLPPLAVSHLTVGGRTDPVGIAGTPPSLAWRIQSDQPGTLQTAYDLEVGQPASRGVASGQAPSPRRLGPIIWRSGRINSSSSVDVSYGGPPLKPSTVYVWRVRVWDNQGHVSPWSSPAWFATGLFTQADWSGAQWIGGHVPPGPPTWPAGTTATASSYHSPGYGLTFYPSNAIDGNTATYWNSAVPGQFPVWLAITSPTPLTLPGLSILSDSNGYPTVFSVDTWNGSSWVRQAYVSNASSTLTEVHFPSSVTTTAVRITVYAVQNTSNGDYARINEVYPGLYDPLLPAPPPPPAPELRKAFTVDRMPVRSAWLYVSAGGYEVPYLNGRRIGDHVLDPGFTVYNKRIQYVTYNVTRLISSGSNVLGAVLGNGFYNLTAPNFYNWNTAPWLGQPRLLAKLLITYANGTQQTVVSNSTWKTHSSPTLADSVYLGETYDAQDRTPGWDTPAYSTASWNPVSVLPAPTTNLVPESQPPITAHATVTATAITNPAPGVYVYKFPYVLSGWARLQVQGPAGTIIHLQYSQWLNSNGTVNGAQTVYDGVQGGVDTYILGGTGLQTWHPSFSYNSFQYVQVTGYPGVPTADSVTAVVLHTDVPTIGNFSSSSPLLNEIYTMQERTVLNNLYGIPTASPTTGKNGWLADAQLAAPGALDSFGMQTFYANWLRDIVDSQAPSGQVPVFAPDSGLGLSVLAPEWSAALPIVAWDSYMTYGNRSVLAKNYAAMVAYMTYLTTTTPSLIFNSSFGDWMSPAFFPPNDRPLSGNRLTATAYVDLDAQLMVKIATALGHHGGATVYSALARKIDAVINSSFLDPSTGYYHGATATAITTLQTPDALALVFGLTPPGGTGATVANLVANVHAANDHLNTGILGTAALLPALTTNGHVNLAYDVATQTTYPSWGYWVKQGLTTDPGIGWLAAPGDHDMWSSIVSWLYSDLVGINSTSPGYGTLTVKPYVPAALDRARASIATIRGNVAVSWVKSQSGGLDLRVTIPANSTATVEVPAASGSLVAVNGSSAAVPGVHADGRTATRAIYTVGSGTYSFTVAG